MVSDLDVAEDRTSSDHDAPRDVLFARAPGVATAVFVGVVVIAGAMFVWFGRDQWFYWDEWEILAGRSGGSARDLLTPWHEHWIGGVIVLYRLLWNVVGINTYLPYQLIAVGAHLAIAGLLWVVMRRAGVAIWIATISAGAFALFGTGKQDIVWAFQLTFTGALLLGLLHMLAADHEGRFGWRDVAGIVAGTAALTFSGLGVVMVGVVALAVAVRRGVVMAMVHAAVPLACFIAWWLGYGRHDDYITVDSSASQVARFVLGGVDEGLSAVGWFPWAWLVLVVVLVGGLAFAWKNIARREVRIRASEPAAMLLGAIAFLAFTGLGRAAAQELLAGRFTYSGRYIHVFVALSLPALAVGIDALARRWELVGAAAMALLLIGVPANVQEIVRRSPEERVQEGDPDLFLAVAHHPRLSEVPGRLQPFPENEQGVITADWLRRGIEDGRIPGPRDVSTATGNSARLRVSILQSDDAVDRSCTQVSEAQNVRLERGQVLRLGPGPGSSVRVQSRASGSDRSSGVTYDIRGGRTLEVLDGPLDVRLAPRGQVRVCT